MSTILKALRRLEQEKTRTDRPLREQVTGIGGGHGAEAGTARRWPILLGGISAGVVAGAAVLFLVLSRADSPSPPPAAEPAPAAAPAAPQAPMASEDVEVIDRVAPAPRIAPAPADEAAPAAEAGPPPGSVRPFRPAEHRALPGARRLPEEAAGGVPVIAAPQPPAPAPPPLAAAEPPVPLAAAEAPARVPAPRAEPVSEAPASAPQAAKPPAPEAAAARPAPVRAPSRPAAPPPDPFPALRVESTTWHPLAERRLAVVLFPGEGARELREGEEVAGVTVSLIEPSGVVFRYAGREVRRKVGGGS